MTDQTRHKIMEVARVLFADKGFEATSVREIAKAAEVNVAAVNYHYSNKENLLQEILQVGYDQVSEELRSYCEQNSPDLEETLVALFRFFLSKSHDLVAMFKIMISSQHSQHLPGHGSEDEYFGPPGGKILAGAICQEVGHPVPEEDLMWALRTLFSHVVHTSILYHCCFKANPMPFTEVDYLERGVRRLARVVLQDLKQR
jgi:AcrR family transcriptional regulator